MEDNSWLTHGVVTSIIATLLVAGGGFVIGYFKKKGAPWVVPVMYGLGAAVLLAALVIAIVGFMAIPSPKPKTTPDNVESQIKKWVEINGVGITRPTTPIPDTYFAYMLTLKNNNQVMVGRAKNNSRRLDFQLYLQPSEEDQRILNALSKDDASQVLQEVTRDLGLAKIGHTISTATPLIQGATISPFGVQLGIVIQKAVPIEDLDEDKFFQAVNEIDSGAMIVKSSMGLALRPYKKQTSLAKEEKSK
jgi:hypothetical protein